MAVWTDYDPLKEIIVGNVPAPDYFKPFLREDVLEGAPTARVIHNKGRGGSCAEKANGIW